MRNWILTLIVLFILAGSVSAAFDDSLFTRSVAVPKVAGLRGEYTDSCAVFNWDDVSDTDFNNFVFTTSSNVTALNNLDVNLVSTTSYSVCTLTGGEWVQAIVYRVDGNSDGLFISETDANYTIAPGTVLQGGNYMVYSVLIAIATIVSLVIVVTVIVIILKKLNIGTKFFG